MGVLTVALPCMNNCNNYFEGCHKECPSWDERRRTESQRRKAINAHLSEQTEVCRIIMRQYTKINMPRGYNCY